MSEQSNEVCLVSRWKLKAGLNQELLATLQKLAGQVEAAEPDTLMYRVHLPTEFPTPPDGAPPIPLAEQQWVIFVEVYRNPDAFATHASGDVFNTFLRTTADFFEPDPNRLGWPVTDTDFMSLVSGYVRDGIE